LERDSLHHTLHSNDAPKGAPNIYDVRKRFRPSYFVFPFDFPPSQLRAGLQLKLETYRL
jgi:hypothetical protein